MLIPDARDSDAPDVRRALNEAERAWDGGDAEQALVWLRRAATLATDRDDDARAVELFNATAELTAGMARQRAIIDRMMPKLPLGDPGAKSTRVTAKTRLRRAMLAIDPNYAKRVDYDPALRRSRESLDADGRGDTIDELGHPAGVSKLPGQDTDSPPTERLEPIEAETERKLTPVRDTSVDAADVGFETTDEAKLDGALQSYHVNVMLMVEEGDVCVLFVPPGAEPPPGVAAALLVPTSERDAEVLARIYTDSDAKL